MEADWTRSQEPLIAEALGGTSTKRQQIRDTRGCGSGRGDPYPQRSEKKGTIATPGVRGPGPTTCQEKPVST